MKSINKRLKPLFLTNLFAGMMFYYAIITPFMHHSGITLAQISLLTVVGTIVGLCLEILSGILADRWSRKGVLMFGLVSLAIATILYAKAHSFVSFAIAISVANIYFAVRSGMYEAMLYDTLVERDDRESYEKYLGKMRAYYATGSVTGSLVGAAVAYYFNFPVVFYMSTVLCLVVMLFLSQFQEPQLHKKIPTTKLIKHGKALIHALSQSKEMHMIVFTSVFVGINFNYMMSLDPLWPVALGIATIWYGPLNGFLLSSQAVAGPLASRVNGSNYYIKLVCFAFFLSATGLLVRNIFIIAISEFILLGTAAILTVLLSGKIQDRLPSNQRSGVESAISTLSTIAFLGSVAVFSYITKTHSVFVASWVLVIIALVAILGVGSSLLRKRTDISMVENSQP